MTRQDRVYQTVQDNTGHFGRYRTGQHRVLRNGETRTKMDRQGQNKTEQDRKKPTTTNQARLIHAKQNRQAKQNKTNKRKQLLITRH